jgi:CBS-domain-containing membrane protein
MLDTAVHRILTPIARLAALLVGAQNIFLFGWTAGWLDGSWAMVTGATLIASALVSDGMLCTEARVRMLSVALCVALAMSLFWNYQFLLRKFAESNGGAISPRHWVGSIVEIAAIVAMLIRVLLRKNVGADSA